MSDNSKISKLLQLVIVISVLAVTGSAVYFVYSLPQKQIVNQALSQNTNFEGDKLKQAADEDFQKKVECQKYQADIELKLKNQENDEKANVGAPDLFGRLPDDPNYNPFNLHRYELVEIFYSKTQNTCMYTTIYQGIYDNGERSGFRKINDALTTKIYGSYFVGYLMPTPEEEKEYERYKADLSYLKGY
jgi:hypothetical protein